jgi:cytochrome c-type biogenesis protein CcmH
MGWIAMLVLALLVLAGLWRFASPDKGALQFLGAALLLALAGYAWHGRPGLEGAPKRPPERVELPQSEFAKSREDMLGRFDRASSWLTIAESYQRRGDTQSAAELLQNAAQRNPRDPDLWVGLGNALLIHGNMMMSPAAQLAFQRAAAIAPDHPAPPFFYGLALYQSGQAAEAERIWAGLIAAAPADAPYRRVIEERLRALRQERAAGAMSGSAPPGQPAPPAR